MYSCIFPKKVHSCCPFLISSCFSNMYYLCSETWWHNCSAGWSLVSMIKQNCCNCFLKFCTDNNSQFFSYVTILLLSCLTVLVIRWLGLLFGSMFPRSTHETFSQKLYQTFKNHKRFSKPKLSRTDFTICHYAGDVSIFCLSFSVVSRVHSSQRIQI